MAWEWAAPAGAAIVGITATGVTVVTSRANQRREDRAAERQRRHALLDAQRQERKDVYLRYLGGIAEVERHLTAHFTAARRGETPDYGRAFDSVHRLARLLDEVRIVGDEHVSMLAQEVLLDANAAGAELARSATEPRLIEGRKIGALLGAIAADLRLAGSSDD